VEFEQKKRLMTHHKCLPLSIKKVGDWIYSNRIKKNLAPSHLAAKMGIAGALIYVWEKDKCLPSQQQLEFLEKLFPDLPPLMIDD
jgi:ribosome-binding protein aMBF1 (putative translation factor)